MDQDGQSFVRYSTILASEAVLRPQYRQNLIFFVGLWLTEILNLVLLTKNKFLQNSSKIFSKIVINLPKIKVSISLHFSRNSIRSEPCSQE